MVIVVMGVSGVGKTTVGRELALELGWSFYDADDLHSPANVERMRSGSPLTDEHRAAWLSALATLIGEHASADQSMVLACSALRRSHREALLSKTRDTRDVHLVQLHADAPRLRDRLEDRDGHFFPAGLLASQFDTLEHPDPDEHVLVLDAMLPVDDLVDRIRASLDV